MHAVDRMWCVAEAFGVGHLPKVFRVPLQPAEVDAGADASSPRCRGRWVAVAVGREVAHQALADGALRRTAEPRAQCIPAAPRVFIGTGDDTALSQQVIAGLRGPALDLTGKTSLPRLSAVLSLADVMLGNDTGPLHLAAALGRPCVAPYTCTKVALHGPYTQSRRVASKRTCRAAGATSRTAVT